MCMLYHCVECPLHFHQVTSVYQGHTQEWPYPQPAPSPHPTPSQAAMACDNSLCQSHENSLGVDDGGSGQCEGTEGLSEPRGFRKFLELRTRSCRGGGVACSLSLSWYTGCHFFSLIIRWLSVSGSHNRQQLSSTLQNLYPKEQPDGTEAFFPKSKSLSRGAS